jgi:hypothetical protein
VRLTLPLMRLPVAQERGEALAFQLIRASYRQYEWPKQYLNGL